MNDLPLLRSDGGRTARIRRLLVGARIEFVIYRQTRFGGLDEVPVGDRHEVDLDVLLGLSTDSVVITWARDDLIEGLAVDTAIDTPSAGETALVSAGEADPWRSCIGKEIVEVNFGWHVSEDGCPQSLWSIRLTLDNGVGVVVALGELDMAGVPRYHADNMVVLFGELTARSYAPSGVIGNAWSEDC